MKTFLLISAIVLASITTQAEAGCRYIYIDGKAHWVCTYN